MLLKITHPAFPDNVMSALAGLFMVCSCCYIILFYLFIYFAAESKNLLLLSLQELISSANIAGREIRQRNYS